MSPRAAVEAALRALVVNRVAVLVVLATGAVLRMWAVQHARFDHDEAYLWHLALDIVRGRSFPVSGVTFSASEAATPGALFHYVIALAQLPSSDPRAGSLFLAALNLLSGWLVFRALRESGHPEAAALALLVLTFSPWSVVFGDRIWTANLLIPPGAAVAFALVRMKQRPRSRAAAQLGFVLVASLQIHPAALHLWTVSVVAWMVLRPRVNWGWLAGGAGAAALTYVPYLVQEVASGFANTALLLTERGAGRQGPGSAAGMVLGYLGFATTDVSYLVVRGFYGGFDPFAFWRADGLALTHAYYAGAGGAALLWAMQAAGWLLVAAGLVLVARRLTRATERSAADVLFAAGALSVLLLYAVSGRRGFAHYIIALAPLSIWPLVLALTRLLRTRLWWTAALYAAALPVAGWLVLRPYYARDALQAIPQQHAVVSLVLEKTGDRRPFELHLRDLEGRSPTPALLAREHHRAVWRVSARARDVFTLSPRDAPAAGLPAGRVVSTADLGPVRVVHTVREGGP